MDSDRKFYLIPSLIASLAAFLQVSDALAFTYVLAKNEAEVIIHPTGYEGAGGELTITLGLHPEFAEMEDEIAFSAEHVAAIWTSLLVREENLGPSLEIPKLGGTDFFGTLIHEFGHTLGLAHPTLMGAEVNAKGGRGKYSMATKGPNGKFDINEGSDKVRGSADDERGDDANAVFFKTSDNNPFTLPESGIIDSTTYSRKLEDLPSSARSPNVASREVASDLFSLPNTEAMIVGGGSLIPGQIRRGLGADDVAGIRYAMSGLDEIQGTADDYTLQIKYVGVSDSSDMIIRFDKPDGFAAAYVGAKPLSGNHRAMGKNRIINYNPNLPGNRDWYYPQPERADFESSIINERAFALQIATEPGVRYGISWPDESLTEEEDPSDIIVQWNGENRGSMSSRLFLFVATESMTEVKVAFPSRAPELSEVTAFKVTARKAN
ncbi:MAG: hypothetical protein P1U68_08935 [Verrucomicrobiales bacterium]|nr:hypothetical protein [Verrucomicrobiales bacterium]